LGMPELDAWKRDQILNYAEKIHKRRVNSAVFRAIVIVNAVIIAMSYLWTIL